jgi:peptidyl-prolyl cis-trans isomerase C
MLFNEKRKNKASSILIDPSHKIVFMGYRCPGIYQLLNKISEQAIMIRIQKKFVAFATVLLLLNFGCGKKEKPPDPDTVATFEGGKITRKELEDHLKKLVQGMDSAMSKQFRRKDVYKDVIRSLAIDYMVKEKIKEKKLDKRENIKHVMKHISEELNIDELHSRAHKGKIKVSEVDIKNYYENNRGLFKDSPLAEVKEEIRAILQTEKEKAYFQDYLAELKKNAVVTREYRLLEVPEPTEADLRMYYEENRRKYDSPDKSFSGVKVKIRIDLQEENEKKWFKQNRNSTLFTVHGKRFTVGDFYQELEELPLDEREKYKNFESRKELMDRMIDRLLIVEDTYDQMLNTENQEEFKHIREDMLSQILHQEEVDDKVEVGDVEMKAYYEEHKEKFVEPPQAKISYIRVGSGQTEDERKRAEKKTKEAYKKLKPGLLKKGEPFEKIAQEYSEDAKTAEKGGRIDGWISESSNLLQEITSHTFHEVVLGLDEGEISSPFYFHGSYYIVKVQERKEPRPQSFEEAREQIKAELSASKHEEMTRKMGLTLFAKANLVIYDEVIESMLKEN